MYPDEGEMRKLFRKLDSAWGMPSAFEEHQSMFFEGRPQPQRLYLGVIVCSRDDG